MTLPGYVTSPAPRSNLAGFCHYCGCRGCASADCIAMYRNSWWAVCDRCHGRGGDDIETSCAYCLLGVVEVGPDHPGAVRGG